MKFIDRLCAACLFVLALVDSLLVPKAYTGRIWIFGTCLALLFTAMLNGLRIRSNREVIGLRVCCIAANITMLAFALALMSSIGRSRTLNNPQLPFAGSLLLIETAFSLVKNS